VGPYLKLDYNLTPKFGVRFRGMGLIGTFEDFGYTYTNYSTKYDYKSGSDFVFGVDAIYHVIGNKQESKFGLRIEGGLGFRRWTQNATLSNALPQTDSSYVSYDNKFGATQLTYK
jgi:hypothetical protein